MVRVDDAHVLARLQAGPVRRRPDQAQREPPLRQARRPPRKVSTLHSSVNLNCRSHK